MMLYFSALTRFCVLRLAASRRHSAFSASPSRASVTTSSRRRSRASSKLTSVHIRPTGCSGSGSAFTLGYSTPTLERATTLIATAGFRPSVACSSICSPIRICTIPSQRYASASSRRVCPRSSRYCASRSYTRRVNRSRFFSSICRPCSRKRAWRATCSSALFVGGTERRFFMIGKQSAVSGEQQGRQRGGAFRSPRPVYGSPVSACRRPLVGLRQLFLGHADQGLRRQHREQVPGKVERLVHAAVLVLALADEASFEGFGERQGAAVGVGQFLGADDG